jgi:hypothetical protein
VDVEDLVKAATKTGRSKQAMSRIGQVVVSIHDGTVHWDVDGAEVLFVDVDGLRERRETPDGQWRMAELWDDSADLPEALKDHARKALEEAGVALVECTLCHQPTPAVNAHRHQVGYVGGECCDEHRTRQAASGEQAAHQGEDEGPA